MEKKTESEVINLDHQVVPFPPIRKGVEDLMWAGMHKHIVHGLGEADVSKPCSWFDDQKEKSGENLSFTAFIIKCLGQAVDEHKFMHACRKGKNKLVIFDEVDVSAIVERDHPAIEGKKMPTTCIIRAANKKSFRQISDELRDAQKCDLVNGPKAKQDKLYRSLPLFLRHAFWHKILVDPFYHKKYFGTVGLTTIGMFTKNNFSFAIPITPATLTLTLGGIYEKPCVVNGEIAIREHMCMTMSVDHDIVDGGPATRFMVRLGELINDGFGLDEA